MQTIISAKGQVVLPKAVRDRFNWQAGKKLDVIEHADGITLRARRTRVYRPTEEVIAELAAINPNKGPMVTDEEMHRLVVAAAVKRYDDTL